MTPASKHGHGIMRRAHGAAIRIGSFTSVPYPINERRRLYSQPLHVYLLQSNAWHRSVRAMHTTHTQQLHASHGNTHLLLGVARARHQVDVHDP